MSSTTFGTGPYLFVNIWLPWRVKISNISPPISGMNASSQQKFEWLAVMKFKEQKP